RRTAAAPAWMIPQVNLIRFGGFNIPFVVCIPRTKVAESADVMKKVVIKVIDKTIEIVLKGNSLKVANRAISVFAPSPMAPQMLTSLNISKKIPAPPKTENHTAEKAVGTA